MRPDSRAEVHYGGYPSYEAAGKKNVPKKRTIDDWLKILPKGLPLTNDLEQRKREKKKKPPTSGVVSGTGTDLTTTTKERKKGGKVVPHDSSQ